jgi:hypothetical protein
MNYNKQCPCCNWKFYVDNDYDGHAVCVNVAQYFTLKIQTRNTFYTITLGQRYS